MRAAAVGDAVDGAEDNNDQQPSDNGKVVEEDDETDKESSTDGGVTVRMVYDGSPAEEAKVQPGDRLVGIDESDIKTISDAIAALNSAAPGVDMKLRLVRNGAPIDLMLTAGRLPNNVPAELPPAYTDPSATDDEQPEETDTKKQGETRVLKLPEFPHKCKIYVPASHEAGRAQAVLLWLHPPGDSDPDAVIEAWKTVCDRDGILLVLPSSSDASRWERTEIEYLRRLSERVLADYKVDPRRVVVYGQGGGGAMAWLLGLSSRDVFRGIATTAAALPRRIEVPANEPSERLAIFSTIPTAKDTVAQISQGLEKLSKAGYPVTTVTTSDATDKLTEDQRLELARWIDTLDRL
jgi:serine protease Do